MRALAKAAEEFYGSLKANGSTEPFRSRMFDFDALNGLIGTPEMLARGKRYEAAADAGSAKNISKPRNVSHGQAFRYRDQERPRGAPEQDLGRLPRYCDQGRKDRPARARYSGRAGEASLRRQESPRIPGLRRCAHAYRHLCAARAGRGVREQGRGHGRRHLKPELPAHRALLSQSRRPLSRLHARSVQAVGGGFLGRLRLPSGADRSEPYRRDGISRHRTRRTVVQDLHVLRRLRAARRLVAAERVS